MKRKTIKKQTVFNLNKKSWVKSIKKVNQKIAKKR